MRANTLLGPLLAVLGVVAGLAGPGSARGADPGGTVFVTERQLGSVTAFDGATGRPLWTAQTGAAPIGVTLPHGTHKVYTSDEGSNQMSVFDARTGAPLGAIPMGPAPHHLLASWNGRRIYVGEFGQNTVGVVDTASDTEIAHFVASSLPNARTHAVFVTPNGKDLYAANTRAIRTQTGDVAHIDEGSGELLCNTEVGIDPSEILVTPDGTRGYVSVRGENKVKELDLRGDCPLLTGREAVVGTQPDTLQLSHDGDTLVVTLRGTPAQISLLDTHSFVVQPVGIPGHTTTGHHWLSQNGEFSFVAVENPGGLAVVDNDTGQVVADYPYPNPPGGNRPHGVFFVPWRDLPAIGPAAASAVHATGVYTGSTEQLIGIEFVAGRHAVRDLTYAVRYHCSTGRSYYGNPLRNGARYPIREGRFHARWTSAGGATVSEVHGRLRGTRARGTVRRTIRIDTAEQRPDPQGDELCDSGVVPFHARSAGARR
jgi:DNA-binding beta-propeller fold protein YncE